MISEDIRFNALRPDVLRPRRHGRLSDALKMFFVRNGVPERQLPLWYLRIALCLVFGALVGPYSAPLAALVTVLALYGMVYHAVRMQGQKRDRAVEEQFAEFMYEVASRSQHQLTTGSAVVQAILDLPSGPLNVALSKTLPLHGSAGSLADGIRVVPRRFGGRRIERACNLLAAAVDRGQLTPEMTLELASYCEPLLRRGRERISRFTEAVVVCICVGVAACVGRLVYLVLARNDDFSDLFREPFVFWGSLLLIFGFAAIWRAETIEG